jgi:hypothetical protein
VESNAIYRPLQDGTFVTVKFNSRNEEAMESPRLNDELDLVWGADAISKIIRRTPRQTFHLLASGGIPPARQIGGRWVVERGKLIAFFRGEAA